MALRRRCTLVRLLMRLHILLLLSVLLFELLSLLSVALFHLLFLSVAGILLGHLLVFFFLQLLLLLVFRPTGLMGRTVDTAVKSCGVAWAFALNV